MLLRGLLALAAAAASLPAQAPQFITLPDQSPLVTMRVVFRTGSASDPRGKEGLAALTAAMLGEGGTAKMTYDQVVDALYPMAVNISYQTDKEMTTFSADTHVDNLDAFYTIFRAILLEPGWRAEDLKRLKDQTLNQIRVNLRANNDEELGKEVLYNVIYAGHPYGHLNLGNASTVQSITLDDLRSFWRANYTRANLTVGLAGGYPPAFAERVKKDFATLAAGRRSPATRPAPPKIDGLNLHIVDKQTRSVAYSFGFPIEVKRGHPDYLALLLAQNFLGPHRSSAGLLYQHMRESRGLNYGDYAYIEYFPRGMFRFEPDPNLARAQQIFQIWIRPVETPTAHFALRLGFHEVDKFIKKGLTPAEFEQARNFVTKNVNLLTKTKRAELGYAIDSAYYGIPEYNRYVVEGLKKLTVEDVNRAIRKHLQLQNVQVVAVSAEGQALRKKLLSNEPSPMKYTAEKAKELLEEDKLVEKRVLPFKAEKTEVIPVDRIFE
jgi:zinc protease